MARSPQRLSGTPDDQTSPIPGRVTAPALRRGLDILELFLDSSEGLRVPEMTAALGIPRASTHELVGALVDRGYLQPKPGSAGQFVLGVKTFQLGGAYERSLDIVEAGREAARAVAAECGETVQIVVRDERVVVYIVRIDSTHSVRLVSDVGSRLPAHCTAGGKVLLASLSPEELATLFPDDTSLLPMTTRSIDTVERLNRELAETRERGWGEEYCESNQDVACVAAPVRNPRGECVAAMSISIPTIRWQDDKRADYVALVSTGARELSTRLGARL
ncbi:IclR family transcriptional regulator [Jiangella asiatica]|uniref:IclR family transcriptional regulator n=1 Tax=Jiangella asiatica TaxID=2530372 RepID=A0A4R5D9D9_9ACTN|nr:IclR family transcriptional regulator [Jiangella asiatica]TDE08361.1 IclR family transcriptional regulator [Jiangella asiatica]